MTLPTTRHLIAMLRRDRRVHWTNRNPLIAYQHHDSAYLGVRSHALVRKVERHCRVVLRSRRKPLRPRDSGVPFLASAHHQSPGWCARLHESATPKFSPNVVDWHGCRTSATALRIKTSLRAVPEGVVGGTFTPCLSLVKSISDNADRMRVGVERTAKNRNRTHNSVPVMSVTYRQITAPMFEANSIGWR